MASPSGENHLPPGFDGVSKMRYLFAGRASKVTPSGRLQSCIIIVLVDAVLVCSHRGGVHRYLSIEAIRSLTTFPRGWLLLNCSGPIPGQQQVPEPSKVHDLMLVLAVPQRLIEVLQRVRAARTGNMLQVSNSDQIPSLADFRLRPLESAPTHAPLRMWALTAAANTQNALDTLNAQLEHSDAPGMHLLANKPIKHAGEQKSAASQLLPVVARGPPFPYAPCDWLSGLDFTTLGEHSTANLIMAVARFIPTREQQIAASGEGGPTNGTATVIFPLHYHIAAVVSFAHARFPHTCVGKGRSDVSSVNLRFLAPKNTLQSLAILSTPPAEQDITLQQQQLLMMSSPFGVQDISSSSQQQQEEPTGSKPLRISEAFLFNVMRKYADKVMHIVSVQRQIISVTGAVQQLAPVNTEGNAFWRNPRIALFGSA